MNMVCRLMSILCCLMQKQHFREKTWYSKAVPCFFFGKEEQNEEDFESSCINIDDRNLSFCNLWYDRFYMCVLVASARVTKAA